MEGNRTKQLNWSATVSRFPQSFHQPSLSTSTVNGSWGRSIPRDPIEWTVEQSWGQNYLRCDAILDMLRPLAILFLSFFFREDKGINYFVIKLKLPFEKAFISTRRKSLIIFSKVIANIYQI